MAATTAVEDGNDLRDLRVFISYPRGGLAHAWAELVHDHLENLGADVWRDQRSIAQGDDQWIRAIREGLELADVVAFLLGRDTERAEWQQNEALHARDAQVPLVVLRLAANVAMPIYLNHHQPVEVEAGAVDGRHPALPLLARRLLERQRRRSDGVAAAVPDAAVRHAARQRELEYLGNLLNNYEFGDVPSLYINLSWQSRRGRSLERSRRTGVFRSDAALRRHQPVGLSLGPAEPEIRDDVLKAFRSLLPSNGRAVRRLAVLGEPGAGKSYSLKRIACEYADAALNLQGGSAAPIPLFVDLGGWTRPSQPLSAYIERRLETVFGGLRRDFQRLRDERRAVLLLDGLNEIPPDQRAAKVEQIRREAQDARYASVLVSCRQRDFEGDCRLPFDQVLLLPLQPWQVREAIRQTMQRDGQGDQADALFWRIAAGSEDGGKVLASRFGVWTRAGLDDRAFWTLPQAPDSLTDERRWRDGARLRVLQDPRSLLKLVGNPYLLTLLLDIHAEQQALPTNRAKLFAECLASVYLRESCARAARHEVVPVSETAWRAALVAVAESLQRLDGAAGDRGARTALAPGDWPAALTPEILRFSIDASVLETLGGDLRFTHQLLQESLAADVLLGAACSCQRPASDFWPTQNGWVRTGWEVVAEIAAEACAGDVEAQIGLIRWLALSAPKVATDVWIHSGRPALPADLLAATKVQWLSRMTDVAAEPEPEARMAIGCWLGALDLDDRPGTSLTAEGLTDIHWVVIDDARSFVYQEDTHPPLPPYAIARYPVTNRQWQAFVDDGGYADDRWWQGLAERPEPADPWWSEPTAPRETVCWYEAMAYCRWLSDRLGCKVSLPTEQQWERATRGSAGREFPWGDGYRPGSANIDETWQKDGPHNLGRTTLVGLYPSGASDPNVQDLAGNVWEWCLNEHEQPQNTGPAGNARRVLRGGSWSGPPEDCRASCRGWDAPDLRLNLIGFRLVVSCPIQGAEPFARHAARAFSPLRVLRSA